MVIHKVFLKKEILISLILMYHLILESITNIIVNPYGDFDSINTDLKDWIQKQNLSDIRIWKSNIPMRKY